MLLSCRTTQIKQLGGLKGNLKSIIGISLDNFCLIVAGLVLLVIGVYRTIPFKFDKAFWWQNGPLLVFLAIGVTFFALRFQTGAGVRWGTASMYMASRFIPLMFLLCLIMGLGGIIVGMYTKEITSFLLNHQTFAPLAGVGIAPTPNTFLGVIEGLWSTKALQANFLFFLNAASIASLPLLMLRTAGFRNMEICHKMYLFGVVTAIASFPLRFQICRLVDCLYNLKF